jgi:hypothetical protein
MEPKNRSDLVSPVPFNDLPKWGDAATASEGSYRRGFMHGFTQAIDAVEKGMSLIDMLYYLNNDLIEWRNSSADREKMPPDLT